MDPWNRSSLVFCDTRPLPDGSRLDLQSFRSSAPPQTTLWLKINIQARAQGGFRVATAPFWEGAVRRRVGVEEGGVDPRLEDERAPEVDAPQFWAPPLQRVTGRAGLPKEGLGGGHHGGRGADRKQEVRGKGSWVTGKGRTRNDGARRPTSQSAGDQTLAAAAAAGPTKENAPAAKERNNRKQRLSAKKSTATTVTEWCDHPYRPRPLWASPRPQAIPTPRGRGGRPGPHKLTLDIDSGPPPRPLPASVEIHDVPHGRRAHICRTSKSTIRHFIDARNRSPLLPRDTSSLLFGFPLYLYVFSSSTISQAILRIKTNIHHLFCPALKPHILVRFQILGLNSLEPTTTPNIR